MGSESLGSKLEKFVADSSMILKLSTKPRWDEFIQLFKIIMLIMLLLGGIGVLIRFLMQTLVQVL